MARNYRKAVQRLVMICAAGMLAALSPQSSPAEEESSPSDIRQQHPTFLVHVDVDKITRAYYEGEGLRVHVTSEKDAYLYVLYQQADGKLFQIYPNSFQKNNRVNAGQTVQIPGEGDRFSWKVSSPLGKESIKVLATKEPLTSLPADEFARRRFNPVPTKTLKAVGVELGEESPAEWAEDQLEITSYRPDQAVITGQRRRFGVFFGVSKYLYNDAYHEAAKDAGADEMLDRPACGSSAAILRALSDEVGQFSETRLYVDEQASRAQMEQSVTKWLPSVSRPGDTVIIYFCGHGSQIDSNSPGKRKDTYLLPYDYADMLILAGLAKQAKEGRLPAAMAEPAKAMAIIAERAGSVQRAEQALVRRTGVTDDQFGHWLQGLAGRQVVVLLEACHSGGFGKPDKGLPAAEQDSAFEFRFLDDQLSRLKSIGQPESALLTACAADENAYAYRVPDEMFASLSKDLPPGAARVKGGMCVMTYYLADALIRAPGSLELRDAYGACQLGMREYFIRLSRVPGAGASVKPHQPHLWNYCTKPAYLKP